MLRFTLLLLLAATPLFAGNAVQETAREFSAAADLNGDGFPDVLVVDKTSGVYRVGYGSATSALTFADGRASGLGTITGCAVGKLDGISGDSFAVTNPTANRAQILSPVTTGYTEPKPAQAAGVGPQLLAAFDLPLGPGATPEDDLAVFATLDPAMGTQLRALRSNAGAWTLLGTTDAPERPVAHGSPLIPAVGAAPLFAYVSADGATRSFHAWELTGAATTEVLTASALPAGTEFLAVPFEAPRADVIFYTPGQISVRVRRIMPGAPWSFGPEAIFTFAEPIEQLAAVSDATGPKVLARFSSGALAILGYTQAGGFSAPLTITPSGVTGVPSGIVPMPGNAFQILFAPSAGDASSTAVTFQHGTGGWVQKGVSPMSPHLPLAANANVMLLANFPFRVPNVALLRAYRAADWATAVSVGAGPFTVNAQGGSYGGPAAGIGAPSPQALGPAAGAPGGTAVNQQHAHFSLFAFGTTLGSAVEDVTIAPDPGTYASAIQLTFTGMRAGSTVFFRRHPTAPFAAWSLGSSPWVFSPATVEYYTRTAGGVISPTRSATYAFSKAPALQDQDGDGVPDFVEIARGLDPAGGADSDGDGFSDRDEIAAGTDPGNSGSRPAGAAPALNTVLVDISARLEDPNNVSTAGTGAPTAGVLMILCDPFGNPAGSGVIDMSSGAPLLGFSRVTAAGVVPEGEYLVARTPEHFDVTPTNGHRRRGREMIGLVPVTPIEPWSFPSTSPGLPTIQTAWSWGGVNWLSGSANWDFGLGAIESFDPAWSTSQLAPEWGSMAAGFTSAEWETQFRAASNRGGQPYARITVTPVTSLAALIAGKLIGDQLAIRSETAVDGTSLAFAETLTATFHGLRLPDSAHASAPAFRVQSLLRDLDTALAGADAGAVALCKIARAVYARHEALPAGNLAALPMPLEALSKLVKTGSLPPAYGLPGTGLTPADLAAANAKLAELAAALTTRPNTVLTLFTRSIPSPAGLTLVQAPGGAVYALFDSTLVASVMPADLPPGSPLLVSAFTDLPSVAAVPALEVISIDLTALPFLVGDDSDGDLLADEWELRHFGSLDLSRSDSADGSAYALGQEYFEGTDPRSAGSSPLAPPVTMEFSEFRLAIEAGIPRLRARWPAAYAAAISVSFDTSPDLLNWSDNPAFSGLNIGSGFFTRDVTLSGPKGFYRARARLKP